MTQIEFYERIETRYPNKFDFYKSNKMICVVDKLFSKVFSKTNNLVYSIIEPYSIYIYDFVKEQVVKDLDMFFENKDCKCGTHNTLGQGHSTWCDLFKKEFI